MLATIQKDNGNLDKAIAEYRKLVDIQPGSVQGLMGLAVLLEQTGALKDAENAYRQVLQHDPKFAPAANNLSWLLTKGTNADLGEAMRLAQLAKESQPRNPYVSDTLGYVYYLRGSYDLATEQLRDAVAVLPLMPTIRFHLALSLKAQGADKEALKELKHSLELKANFPERHDAKKLLQVWQKPS